MVKVIYAHHDGSITGSAISLRNLLAALDRKAFSPRVALFSDGPARRMYEELHIPVDVVTAQPFWTFPGSTWTELSFYINFLALLPNNSWKQYLIDHQPDILHVNDKSCLQAGATAGKLGIPVIWHLRSSYYPSKSKWHAAISARVIRKNANRLIAISEDETDGFQHSDRLNIIYNSVDLSVADEAMLLREKKRAELGLSSKDILIGQVSTTINEVRGTWDFLHACGLIGRKIGNLSLRYMIVAGIPERKKNSPRYLFTGKSVHPEDQVWQIAKEENITDRLTLTGFRKDVVNLMAAMDVVVVCNRHGVLGRMPFEAMSLGRPLVVTAGHSGQSRIVIDQETALVVPPATPAGIADAVCNILMDQSLAQAISNRGLTYARQHFDPLKNARLVEKVYRDLLKERGGNAE